MIGASSGGVLGLLLAGLLGLGQRFTGTVAMVGTVLVIGGCALALAMVNLRGKPEEGPSASRALYGVVLTSGGLLLTLLAFLVQSVYIQILTGRGAKTQPPLAIWPFSRILLVISLLAAAAGVAAALLGAIQSSRLPERPRAGRWVAMSLLTAGAWVGLALAVYATGYGLVFGG